VIVQWTRRDVPGREANGVPVAVRRVILRHPSFAITVLRSNGLATDWGMQGELVTFIARMTRTQLSILLEGRGYLAERTLSPGDMVWSDQRLAEPEGYAGTPCEALFVEWDEGVLFGPAHRGANRAARMGKNDIARLRALTARVATTPPEQWSLELASMLRTIGFRTTEHDPHAPSERHAQLYAKLGDAISRLDVQPSLGELARSLSVTERQANRQLRELEDKYAHRSEGWREFIQDARLGWATQLLSVPDMTLAQVAALAGYRSDVALSHAFRLRGAGTPGSFARRMSDRWG
jgi:AraC-like DNA-binding protein